MAGHPAGEEGGYPSAQRLRTDRSEAKIAGAALALSLVLAYSHAPGLLPCPSYVLFHTPCPGCGLTRSILVLWRGDLIGSLRFHPAGLVLFAISWGAVLRAFTPVRHRAFWRFADGVEAALAQTRGFGALLAGLVVLWVFRMWAAAHGGTFFHW